MAGHVHHSRDTILAEVERSEIEVDGDASALFLRETVHRTSGERRHQGGFPVIDVTRGADDHAAIHGRRSQNSSAGSSAPSPRW